MPQTYQYLKQNIEKYMGTNSRASPVKKTAFSETYPSNPRLNTGNFGLGFACDYLYFSIEVLC